MLLLTIDGKSAEPHYRQIIDQIRRRIDERILRPGELLPSTRRLAAQLGVHRSTVATAYHELWALGLIDLRPGARPCVRHRPQVAITARRKLKGIIDWSAVASPAANALHEIEGAFRQPPAEQSTIDFSRLEVDPRLYPLAELQSSIRRAMRRRGTDVLRLGDSRGFEDLREALAVRLRAHGIAAEPDEILITNGSQHAIDLVLQMIAAPGRPVVVESPTYDYLPPLVRFHRMKAVEVPVGPEGMELKRLAAAVKKHRPALVYTMPNFHNPTGITTAQAHREELLAICEAGRVPLLEDGFEEEMKYFGRVVLPIKSMDRHHAVIYCGTLSKVLLPGFRVGWVVAERGCVDRLAAIRRFSEIAPNMLLHAAVCELYESGLYDRHVSRMHRVFRRRMQTAIRALRGNVPPELAEWSEPAGGFIIWLAAKARLDPAQWQPLFASHRIRVAPGGRFFASRRGEQYIRLSIASLDERQIVEGVQRLASALRDAQKTSRRKRYGT